MHIAIVGSNVFHTFLNYFVMIIIHDHLNNTHEAGIFVYSVSAANNQYDY